MTSRIYIATAHTKSTLLQYEIEFNSFSPMDCVHLENRETFRKLCFDGCTNYEKKWSCPPYSPSFYDISHKWDKLFIIYMRIDTDQFIYIKNDYLKIKAANTILKSRVDKFLRNMAKKWGRYISTGSCRLCKPCKCKSNLPCAHPDDMAYSFEALGINVDALVNMCFQKPLLWYGRHNLPKYTSVVCGLLTNESVSQELFADEYFKIIKY